jgi:hypothetical protein
MRSVFRSGSCLLFAATAMSLAGCQDSTDDIGVAVDLNSNVINGTIAFTNANPAILAILHGPGQSPPGADDGFSYISIAANSTNVSPPLNNSSGFGVQIPPNTRTSVGYEITNEAGVAGSGVIYDVGVDAYLDGSRDYYRFAQLTAAPLERSPALPVTLDFRECAGVVDIRWEDTAGNPVAVRGGYVYGYRERTPGGSFDYQANTSLPSGSARELMAVRGGARFLIDVTYDVGNDPFSNQFRYTHRADLTVACDQIAEIVIVIPDGSGALGAITGQIDMLGEDELRISQFTRVLAQNGPFGNFRYDFVNSTPSQGTFMLENLVPSSVVTPAQGYTVYGDMYFRHDGLFQYFRTPFLEANNGRVPVNAGETVDLGDTLVMDPGYVGGDIFLAGPPPGAGGSCIQALGVTQDPGGQNFASLPSYLEASGINQLATNATKTGYGGFVQAAFRGAYDPAPGVQGFAGDYEMALGGLLQEATRWQTGRFWTAFSRAATPQDPLSYQSSGVLIRDQRPGTAIEVVPGQTTERPVRHCFGQLNLAYFSSGARFYSPRASGSGALSGTDFEGNPASYTVALSYAYGTPFSNAPGNEGMVVMCLPEGEYDLTPMVTTINPNGTTSATELPPVLDVEVSCREVKTITPELSMDLDATPVCTAGATLALTGNVDSQDVPPQPISSVTAAVNAGDPISVCTGCGVDPSFSAEVPLAACENRVVVRAEDAAGSFTEIERTVTRDGNAPELAGCADITVEADPALGGAYVAYSVAGSDDCTADVGVVCDVASGSFFAAGQSTSVTCRAADTCGNEATCSFAVRVDEPARCEAPDPREQDYWRTQCNDRGPDGSPPDPAWTAESFQALLDGIEPDVQAVCGASETSCQALNPDPYWDLCEQACQQYTAVLLNIASDLLPASCCTLEGNAGDLPARLASMIAAGECSEVIDIAYELNRGCLFCEQGH